MSPLSDDEVDRLGTVGFFVRPSFLGRSRARQMAAHASALFVQGAFRPAGVSRHATHRIDPVRNDDTCWLDSRDPEALPLAVAFESLRHALNESVHLGLRRFDIQLARYEGNGARYRPHRDAFPGEDNRRITAIVYLNPDWRTEHGGLLKLEGPLSKSSTAVEVTPALDTLVVFLSEGVEHEVLPSYAPRFAATAWFYGRDAGV